MGFSFAITNTRSGTHDVALLLNLCHLSVVLATSQSQFIQYFALGWFAATHTPFNEMWGISLLQFSCLYCLWILCLSDQCVITDSPTPVALYGNDLRVDLAFFLLMPQPQPHTPWSYYSLLYSEGSANVCIHETCIYHVYSNFTFAMVDYSTSNESLLGTSL